MYAHQKQVYVKMFRVMTTHLSSVTWTRIKTVDQKTAATSALETEHTTQQTPQKIFAKWLLLTSLECIPINHDFLKPGHF
jgi:hypothetical protein